MHRHRQLDGHGGRHCGVEQQPVKCWGQVVGDVLTATLWSSGHNGVEVTAYRQ
jgi:hypothetical protein